MCLIVFAWQAHADHRLVVAGNRDEFFERPTASANWSADGRLLHGRDLRAGGTWMGVSRSGRFAALTNHRDPAAARADAPSRGELVSRVLASPGGPEPALEAIAAEARRFNGFNLIAAQWRRAPLGFWVVSSPGARRVEAVAPGVHAISNARLDTPWPKVERATVGLGAALADAGDRDELAERLFAMLQDPEVAPDDRLPATGVTRETERALSASFIRMPGYGTRASTVFIVDRRGDALFVERRFEPDAPVTERRFPFGPDCRAMDASPAAAD